MYARLAILTVGSGMRERMEKLADEVAPHYKAQKGIKSLTFFADDAANEYGTISLWETREDAEAVNEALAPILREKAGEILTGPPAVRYFEVYEPKT